MLRKKRKLSQIKYLIQYIYKQQGSTGTTAGKKKCGGPKPVGTVTALTTNGLCTPVKWQEL